MRLDWLTDEVKFRDMDEELRSSGVADEWARLAAKRRKRDRLMAFTSPPAYWQAHEGCAGYALLRDGEIVSYVVTMTN